MNLKKVIWIASFPKSGNTWFRAILTNLLNPSNPKFNINELAETPIASSRIFFDYLTGTNSSDLTDEEINNLRPQLYKTIAQTTDTNIFLKVHDAWHKNEFGIPIFPKEITKGVIYLVRNPLDVAVSLAYHNDSSFDKSVLNINNPAFSLCNNPAKLHNQLNQLVSSWSKHVKSWISDSNLPVTIVKFEDLYHEPTSEILKVLKFLGLDYSLDQVKNATDSSSFNNLKNQEMEHGFKEKPINATSFFREGKPSIWHNYLNQDEIENISKANYKVMNEFGY